MKTLSVILTAMLTLLVVGCGAKYKVDTNKLTTAFASAPAELKGHVDALATAVKAGNYADAVEAATKAAAAEGMSAEQKTALYDAVVELDTVIDSKKPANADELRTKTQELVTQLL